MPESVDSSHIGILAMSANFEIIDSLFENIIGRKMSMAENNSYRDCSGSIGQWIKIFLNSDEYKAQTAPKNTPPSRSESFIPDQDYRVPSLVPTESPPLVLVVGSCMTDSWQSAIEAAYPNTKIHRLPFNNGSELEDLPEEIVRKAAFQIVQLPLRAILLERQYFSVPVSDEGRAEIAEAFDRSVVELRRNLNMALKYNKALGLTTFVVNFAVPQANPLGRLLPKYDLINMSHYIRELNRVLYEAVAEEKSVHLIDFDEIAATIGKRFIQDDITSHICHGSFIGEMPNNYDIHLTPYGSMADIYGAKRNEAAVAIFNECVAAYNIISSSNKIKIVVFDLDGTLWRGVPADGDDVGPHLIEGWPLSILEAAMFLKKRGILIAIASKNDPDVGRRTWNELYGHLCPLSNFAAVKFSWKSKSDSIAEILRETNLLSANCLFVDDNPIEREQAQLAFPDIKVIDGPIFTWRRTLLWATELQVPYITNESAGRTASIQAMIQRESIKKEVSEDDYTRDLNIKVQIEHINALDHKKFPRAFELLNKTNQFNTTGRRWSEAEMVQYFAKGGSLLAVDVSDRLSHYGLTAVLLQQREECSQIVMSCRVFGLRVEFAIFKSFLEQAAVGRYLLFRDTGKNGLCRKFLDKIGVQAPSVGAGDEVSRLAISADYHLAADLTAPISMTTDAAMRSSAGGERFVLAFGLPTNTAENCIGDGWSYMEPHLRWMLGERSQLALPSFAATQAAKITVRLMPHIWKDRLPQQQVTILLNDVRIGACVLRAEEIVSFSVSANIFKRSGGNAITFIHPDAASPASTHGTDTQDNRLLAIGIVSLEIDFGQ